MKQFDTETSVKTNFRKLRFAILFSCSMAFSYLASATNFTPTTFTDPDYTSVNNANGVITGGAGVGLISLRSALQAADATAGPHTITLLGGTYNVTGGNNIGTWIAFGSVNNQNITINGVAGSPLTSIINMAGVGAFQDRIFGINVLTLGGTVGVNCAINNVRFTNGHLNSDTFGGGAIEFAATGSSSAFTLTNCEFINNTIDPAAGTTGGAVNYSGTGTFTVTNCTFTGNSNGDSDGGAIYYFHNNFAGNQGFMNVTNCTFTNNTVTAGAANGGAIGIALQGRIAPFDQNFTANITRNTFITNTAPAGQGGAIIVNNGDAAYIINIHFNRFLNNATTSTTTATSGLGKISSSGNVNAINNWWGCNTDPLTAGACNRAAIVGSGGTGTLTTNPWLQLKTTASPNPICNTPAGLGNTTTVTTSFLSNSAGTAVLLADIVRLIGLPVTWGPTTLGTLSGQQGTIQANGTATATFTSNGTGGNALVNTQVDNVPTNDLVARATIVVNTIPIVTDPVNFTSCVGGTATFTSTITGTPAPTITWYKGGVPIVNGPTGTGATYSGATTNTLTITNVQVGDAGNYNVDAVNQCGTDVSAAATLFVNQVTGGTVGSDQTICEGGDPALFTELVASTGSGALTYQWQSSTTSCIAGFSDIGGATATTYDPPAGLLVTTYYRRITTSTLNAVPCPANSNCITVTVNAVTGGTVDADQTICSGGDPAAFTQSVASTGSGALTYQWQSSTTSCVAGFSDIGGATATTYDPPSGLTVTTFYRRVTTSTLSAVPCTANSNCITVFVNDVTAGSVGSDQTVCSGGNPAAFTVTVAATGSGALTYQWESSTTSCASGFSNIGGATAATYDAPAGLLVTTFYRRVTTSTLNAVPCTATSNCITVTVNDVTGGTVAADQTICSGGDPAAFTQTVASTGSGALTYQWQSSTTSCAAGFSDIGGATGTTYDPPAGLGVTTYYRRVTTSTLNAAPCTANSNCITVTVNLVTGGTVGSDHSVCPAGDPAAFTESVGSTGGGVLTYQWQSSTTSCVAGFSDIALATSATYDAPAGLGVTTYYRRVTTSTLNAVLCTANSNCITVTVNLTNTITLTSAAGTDNQTVLINTPITNITYATTGATGATVTGLPTGVNGNWAANVVTISGTPTVAGSFNYTVTLTGGCGVVTASGTINVVVCSITLTSAAGTDAQTVCVNAPITNITYSTTNATGASFSGLPPGVNGVWATNVVTISGTPTVVGTYNYTVTPTGGGCTGSVTATGTITVNPIPDAVATPSSQTVCSGDPITTIVLSGSVGGTTYNWTRDNTGSVTGIAASGSGNISGTLTNTTAAPITVTFTITPTASSCTGSSITATVLVNPTPDAVATPPSQTICSGATITTIVLSSATAGTTYGWTRDNTVAVTGIAASGTGNISGSLTNTTAAPVTVTFTITPTANGCPGAATTATVLVNPTPDATATPSSQTICSGATITTIVLSSATAGTTYGWTRDNTVAVTGIAASGTGNISGALTNTTNAPVTVTFTITPTANSCPGSSITATVLVNPTPNAVATPSSQTTCSGQTITTIVLSSATAGTTYTWTRDNIATVTGIAAAGSGNISGALTNTTASPITVTFTIIPTANSCPGAAITATVLVNPTPDATATPSSQTVCSNVPITTIVITGSVSGTVFNWVRDNTGTVTGIAASGTGNISGTLTNTTNAPVTVTFTITPTASGCTPGAPTTATVLVNPIATVNQAANQVRCHNTATAAVNFTSPTTGGTIVYNWTNDNTSIGLGASGTGNIPSFTATNTGITPQVATITVTPTYTNGVSCTGTPMVFTYTVNPIPNAVATPPSQTICSANPITTIVLSGNVSGTTYTWTRNNTVNVTGIAASGTGDISGTLTNTTNTIQTVTFTITPTANGCTGPAITATVTVNPTPTVNPPLIQVIITGNGGFADEITWTLTNSLSAVILSGGPYGFNPPPTPSASVPATNAPFEFFIEAQGTFNDNSALWEVRCNGAVVASGCIRGTGNGSACPNVGTLTVSGIPGCDPLAPQTICSGSAIAPITLTGPVAGTTFNWTRNNTVNVTGIPASGTGTISGTLTNTTNVAQVVVFTITPSANGCNGTPVTATITVNPIPNAVATPSSQTICSGTPITTIALTGNVAGTVYNWTRNNTANITGIPASGTGNISGTLTNTTTSLQTTTFTITPSYTNAGVTCTGTPITATVSVQAPLTIVCPANITVNAAAGTCAATVSFAATVTGTPAPTVTYSPASGSSFPVGTTTVTATATNICATVTCTFTVTVLDVQIPVITTQPLSQSKCVGDNVTFTVVSTFATVYQWQFFNGTGWVNITGANASSYTVTGVTLAMNTNSFRVLITGPCGTVTTSNPATLTVNVIPSVVLGASIPPIILPTQTVTLTATVFPTGGTFVWRKNGNIIAGATGSSLGPLSVNDVGSYTVTYTVNGCSATSNILMLSAKESDHFYVYPNPNMGQFQVRFFNQVNEPVTVTVYDARGAIVYQRQVTTTTPYTSIDVNLGNNPQGSYLVELRNSAGQVAGAKWVIVFH